MKKTIALLLTLAMLLSLTACSISFLNREVNNSDVKPEQPPAVQPEEPSVPDGDEDDIGAVEPEIPAGKPDTLLPDPEKDDGKEPAAEETRTVMSSHKDVTLFSAGETFRLTVWDSNGKDPDTCTYTSADPSVAAVDEGGGEVTAVAPGTTTVTAHVTYGDETQDFDCIVRCSWKEETSPSAPEETSPGQTSASLNDFFSTLQSSYEGLNSMMVLDGELLDTYYPGLSSIAAVEEVLVQETMMTMSNVAVGLVKLSDSATIDDVVAVQNALQTRINTQADGGAWYPASCETWKNGIITSTSNVVGMFVYPENAQDMADLFTATFSN